MTAQAFSVRSAWLAIGSRRLDASAYSEGGLAAVERIKSRNWRPLSRVARIFRGPLHKRAYVFGSDVGVPYITASDVALADPSSGTWLSKKLTPELPLLLVQEGWTLISSAGTIGNATFVGSRLSERAVSQDMIRVVPTEIDSGYLFAFLATDAARSMLKLNTYGSVVQRIEPKHIEDIPVPLLDDAEMVRIGKSVWRAAAARAQADVLIREASSWIDKQVPRPRFLYEHAFAVDVIGSYLMGTRLDAFHNVGWAAETQLQGDCLADIAEVTRPAIIKRRFAELGTPFVSGIDVYQVRPTSHKTLMTDEARKSGALLTPGQVLVQRSGQRYGLLGRPAYIGARLDGWAASEDLMRVTPRQAGAAARVFALLRSEVGRRSLIRMSYGTSIPHFNQEQLSQLRVPALPVSFVEKVETALALRESADLDEAASIAEVATWLG